MFKVMVTGSAGFIGHAVEQELMSRDMIMVSFDAPLDITRAVDVYNSVKSVDAVINLAGMLGTSEMFDYEARAAEVNIVGALHVMDACHQRGIPMVQIAAGHEGQPNPYAITKKCITDLALARGYWRKQKISVVRAYHAYGPGQKMCQPHGKGKVRKIVPSFVARALTGMDVEINGDGKQEVDLVYVDDVAKALVDAIHEGYGLVAEAGTGVATTVLDAAKTIIDRCGSTSKIVHIPMRDGEIGGTRVVASKPVCPHVWSYKLEETIKFYRENLEIKASWD